MIIVLFLLLVSIFVLFLWIAFKLYSLSSSSTSFGKVIKKSKNGDIIDDKIKTELLQKLIDTEIVLKEHKDKHIVVAFTQKQCGACHAVKQSTKAIKNALALSLKCAPEHVDIIYVDVQTSNLADRPVIQYLAAEGVFQGRGVPLFCFIQQMKIQRFAVGFANIEALAQTLLGLDKN